MTLSMSAQAQIHPGSAGISDPAADNIRAIVQLERQALRQSTIAERLGHVISGAIGTMAFVVWQTAAMLGWIGWNVVAPQGRRFDPYPFGLLTFIVSLEGVLIATFVLIAQNRMSRQSDQRDHLNLQLSLLAEQEMTSMLRLLRRMAEHFGLGPDTPAEERAVKLTEETNVYELVQALRRELPEIERERKDDA